MSNPLDRIRRGMVRNDAVRLATLALARGILSPDQAQAEDTSDEPIARVISRWIERGWVTGAQSEQLVKDLQEADLAPLRGGTSISPAPPEVLEAADMPDRVIGRYVLVEEVGRGGMGTVWRSWDRDLGRWVAVKRLRDEASEAARVRIRREAQAAARLHHPHLVTVYEAGEDRGRPYLVMELVRGRPLGIDGPLAARIDIIRKVAVALEVAHREGVVHRDLKPENILIDDRGEPRVVDFGLAHMTDAELRLTRTGTAIGTPQYMAPEQVKGDVAAIGPRTDVYALGAILYEAIARKPVHPASSATEIFHRILYDDPAMPAGPQDLGVICLKALEKDPARRYASAAALAEDLRRYLDGEPILARPASMMARAIKKMRKHPAAATLAAVLVLGALAAAGTWTVLGWRRAAASADLRRQAESAELRGRFDEAIRHLEALVARDPSPWADARLSELRLKRADQVRQEETEAKRSRAQALIGEADTLRGKREGLVQRLPGLVAAERTLSKAAAGFATAEEKRKWWAAQDECDRVAREIGDLFSRQSGALVQAYGIAVEPERSRARALLAGLYWKKLEEAERSGDRAAAALYEGLVRQYDDESRAMAKALEAPGILSIDSHPAGAEVILHRYVAGPDRRLLPQAIGGGGRCPLNEITLPQGSYLAILRKEGYRDTRFPIRIDRGAKLTAAVALYTEAEIGPDYVFVPAGRFIAGGDPEAVGSLDRNAEASTGDFFISRCEVTAGAYLDFLNDRSFHSFLDAQQRLPRPVGTIDQYYWGWKDTVFQLGDIWERGFPIAGISWKDAEAYARWMDGKGKARGDKRLVRLPTALEWEKAGRGVDGRFFPWGDAFDFSFALGGGTKPGSSLMEPVGSYACDESPYGARDMAGSVQEYSLDGPRDLERQRHVLGGAYTASTERTFRLATRHSRGMTITDMSVGFRLVRVDEDH